MIIGNGIAQKSKNNTQNMLKGLIVVGFDVSST
jgi:hypothetical protein